MSTKPPFDPFGQNERTVIRPNPGGRRQAPQPPSPGPSPPADDAWISDPHSGQPTQAPAAPAEAPAAAPPASSAPPGQTGHAAPPSGVKASDLHTIRSLGVADDNPIMRAARPLLVLLSNLRLSGSQQKVAPLMEGVAQAISDFERDLYAAGIPEDQVVTAKYVMCATADDIVQNIPGSDRNVWTQYSMLSRFFQERTSGVGFFDELAKVKANPALHYHLLGLMHACLSLGFEGQYRTSAGGDVALQQIRRDVYHTLRHIRARPGDEISPHWRGQEIAAAVNASRLPVWVVASVAGVALLGIFVALRVLLSGSADAFAERMLNLHPQTEIAIARDVYEPFDTTSIEPSSTQLERIRAALADEIADDRVAVDPAGKNILTRLVTDALFESGSTDLKEDVLPVLAKVAQTLDKEPKEIFVVGHSDNVPLRSKVRFKSNHDLSVQRAQAVAEVMRPHLADPDRLVIDGRGPDDPIASNDTAEGRARNRRVDILLPREDL